MTNTVSPRPNARCAASKRRALNPPTKPCSAVHNINARRLGTALRPQARFGQQEKRAADRLRHRLGIAANARKGPVRLLHPHAGKRAHGADDVEQLAHAGDVGLDLGETHHGRSPVAVATSRPSAPVPRAPPRDAAQDPRKHLGPIVERQSLGAMLSEPGAETGTERIHPVERDLVEHALRHREQQRDLLAECRMARTAAGAAPRECGAHAR